MRKLHLTTRLQATNPWKDMIMLFVNRLGGIIVKVYKIIRQFENELMQKHEGQLNTGHGLDSDMV